MLKNRLIAVLIVREGQVVQSIRFRHTNVIHYDPLHAIEAFNKWAVDEIILLNVSRTGQSRDPFLDTVLRISRHCFVPLTVGGWISDLDYAQSLLRNGADKLALNTALADDSQLVKDLSRKYGAQCIVASMDIKRRENGEASVFVDRGTRDADAVPIDWAKRAEEIGAGEILFNSIDHDGARRGYDLETLADVCDAVSIPVIAFGGVFAWKHLLQGLEAGASAVAAANIWHYTEQSTRRAKSFLADAGVPVRLEGQIPSRAEEMPASSS